MEPVLMWFCPEGKSKKWPSSPAHADDPICSLGKKKKYVARIKRAMTILGTEQAASS